MDYSWILLLLMLLFFMVHAYLSIRFVILLKKQYPDMYYFLEKPSVRQMVEKRYLNFDDKAAITFCNAYRPRVIIALILDFLGVFIFSVGNIAFS